jgi:hypothetical protein
MAGYAALAVGLINLRYQTGAQSNLAKSLVLIAPALLLIGLTFIEKGRLWLSGKTATAIVLAIGALLAIYSFLI